MANVVEFLKSNSVAKLKSEYSIKVKKYSHENLLVLNYTNGSPNKHPITKECRGLILSSDYRIISRSFDRFYNYNENVQRKNREQNVKDEDYFTIEKIDGSIIKVYRYNGEWQVSTRGTAFAECTIGRTTTTYKQAVCEALNLRDDCDKFQDFCENNNLNDEYTYIFELTGKANRIVTEYNPHKYQLWLLGVRRNDAEGAYLDLNTVQLSELIERPKVYAFQTIAQCIEYADKLTNLDEGFVICNQNTNEPIYKIKSPHYVRMHNMITNNNSVSKTQICTLIANGEWTEFLAYFPMHKDTFDQYNDIIRKYFCTAQIEFDKLRKTMITDTDFQVFRNRPWCQFAVFAIKENKTNLFNTFMSCENEKTKINFLLHKINLGV